MNLCKSIVSCSKSAHVQHLSFIFAKKKSKIQCLHHTNLASVLYWRFLLGFFLAAIPWYAGAFLLFCVALDHREKPGLIACTVAVSTPFAKLNNKKESSYMFFMLKCSLVIVVCVINVLMHWYNFVLLHPTIKIHHLYCCWVLAAIIGTRALGQERQKINGYLLLLVGLDKTDSIHHKHNWYLPWCWIVNIWVFLLCS